jgi:HEAT repeat protein
VLASDDPDTRESALNFLSNLEARGETLRETLTRLVESDRGPWNAYELLGKFGASARSSLPAVKRLMLDPDPHTRSLAARTLAAIDRTGKDVLPDLLEMLSDRDAWVRMGVLNALGEMGPAAKPTLERIRVALRDSTEKVRLNAAVALWRITGKKEESLAVLTSLYRDGNPWFRALSVKTMRRIEKNKNQLLMLLRLLEDENVEVRSKAFEILSEMGTDAREVLPEVEPLTRHRNYEVRRIALQLKRALSSLPGDPNYGETD